MSYEKIIQVNESVGPQGDQLGCRIYFSLIFAPILAKEATKRL